MESPIKKQEGVNPEQPLDNSKELTDLLTKIDTRISQHSLSVAPMSKVPYSKLLFTYASPLDKLLLCVGLLAAICCGAGLPSFVFLFGDITDSFEGGQSTASILEAVTGVAKSLTWIGLGVWVTAYTFFTMMIVASERIGQKTRVAYLKAVLA